MATPTPKPIKTFAKVSDNLNETILASISRVGNVSVEELDKVQKEFAIIYQELNRQIEETKDRIKQATDNMNLKVSRFLTEMQTYVAATSNPIPSIDAQDDEFGPEMKAMFSDMRNGQAKDMD